MDLSNFRTKLSEYQGSKKQIEKNISNLKSDIKKSKSNLITIQEAKLIIQTVAHDTQNQLEYHLNELVSLAMKAIWRENAYELKMQFNIKRGRTEAEPLFVKDNKKRRPLKNTGFGPVDVASFFLRPTLWSLENPKKRNTFFYDEPFRHLNDPEGILHKRAAQMIQEASKRIEGGIQIIIVTQKHELIDAADKTFYIDQKNGKSFIKEN